MEQLPAGFNPVNPPRRYPSKGKPKKRLPKRKSYAEKKREKLKNEYMRQDAEDGSGDELGASDTFEEYWPKKLTFGAAHPDSVVETSSLASVEPNEITYQLSIDPDIIESGSLSALQLESICYACQAHEISFVDGSRAGFLIGDGAGVGKGRTIAGLILENYLRGRERAIWFSVSNDLKYDAERDLCDIQASQIPVMALNKLPYSKIEKVFKKGVIFSTYSALVGKSKTEDGAFKTRLNQLLQWCGSDFDGCIVFDESHKAKNLAMEGAKNPTKAAQAVLDLQMKLPKARIVYASATGASETRNMAYMVRLGLWGKGTPFREFSDFYYSVEKRGIGIMEIVAMDMKQRGMYIARQLSFKGVSFRTEEAPISEGLSKIYDESVELWTEACSEFENAAELLELGGKKRMMVFGQFWGAHQRFFRYLCMAAKIDRAVEIAREAIAAGQCVVIGLQSTGEARTLSEIDAANGELTDFVSGAKGVFEAVVDKHFPLPEGANRSTKISRRAREKRKAEPLMGEPKYARILSYSESEDSDLDLDSEPEPNSEPEDILVVLARRRKNVTNKTVFKANPRKNLFGSHQTHRDQKEIQMTPEQIMKKTMEMREELLRKIEELGARLPKNMLDDLVHKLGGPDLVAEMTGRKGRVVKSSTSGLVEYESRAEIDIPLDKMNLTEKDRFMNGDKLIAIISEAASSGISLQSDRRVANKRQRLHITMELPWSADRAIQQFGRTHRSNQVNAPSYVFVISDLAGERRFAATVARRLESLGALTHGDRRATETQDLSAFNMDNKFGRAALAKVMKSIWQFDDPFVPVPKDYPGNFIGDASAALVSVGLKDWISTSRADGTGRVKPANISKFLNRLLGMPVRIQNALFQYFIDTLSATIAEAKRLGRYDYGIQDLGARGEDVLLGIANSYLLKHATGHAPVLMHKVSADRGLSWEKALEKLAECPEKAGFYMNFGSSAVSLVVHVGNDRYQQMRPNTGLQANAIALEELQKHYKVPMVQAERHWREQYDFSLNKCSHFFFKKSCARVAAGFTCEHGMRKFNHHVLSGSVFSVWTMVEGVLAAHFLKPKAIQVLRVKASNDLKIVGINIPRNCVDALHNRLLEAVQSLALQVVEGANADDNSDDEEADSDY